jgi:hypothetical protein
MTGMSITLDHSSFVAHVLAHPGGLTEENPPRSGGADKQKRRKRKSELRELYIFPSASSCCGASWSSGRLLAEDMARRARPPARRPAAAFAGRGQ